jgi:hypothetical protein
MHRLPEISDPLPKRFKLATFTRSADLYKRVSPEKDEHTWNKI